jgi:hypothetical protein
MEHVVGWKGREGVEARKGGRKSKEGMEGARRKERKEKGTAWK